MQGIEFQIVNDSAGAVVGIEQLKKSLEELKTSIGGGSGLGTVAKNIAKIRDAVSGLNTAKIANLATALENLKTKTEGLKISASIGNQLAVISRAINNLPDVTGSKLAQLADGLRPLSELGKSNLSGFFTQLKKLPEVVAALDSVDLDKFADQMQRLAEAMRPFADEMQKVSNGFSAFPSRIQRLVTSTEKYNAAVYGATKNTARWGGALKTVSFVALGKAASSTLAKAIGKASEYTEALNMFTVSMGGYGEEAYNYAQKVSAIMGIDPASWMENQGVFNSIITGFGVAADKAAIMSKNLTQLGYDLSSFYNISVQDAMQKVQSGISGELEPLRRLGYDLSVARLQQEALDLGIEKSVSDMTQAEKAQLRYHAMLTQVTMVQGDMARTLEQPANQLRVLKMQVEQAARAFGNLFIPVLNEVLPVAIAVAQAVREVISSIAALFGIEMADSVDFSSGAEVAAGATEEIAESVDDAAGSAKKLKSYLMGFDELNVLSADEGSGSALENIGGSSIELEPIDYDFLSGAVTERVDAIRAKIEPLVTWITEHMEGILKTVGAIGVVMLAWRVGSAAVNGLSALKAVVESLRGSMSVVGQLAAWLTSRLTGANVPLSAAAANAGKIAAIAGTIAVIVLRFVDLYNNSEKFRTGLERLGTIAETIFGGMKKVLGDVWGELKKIGRAILGLLPEPVKEAFLIVMDTIREKLALLDLDFGDFAITIAGIAALFVPGGQLVGAALLGFEAITLLIRELGGFTEEEFDGILQSAKDLFGGIWENMKAAFARAKESIGSLVTFAKDLVSGLYSAIKVIFSGLIDFIGGAFTLDWKKAWEGIKEIVRGVFVGIKSIVISAMNVVIRALNRIHVDIPDWVPGIGGRSFGINIPEIEMPKLANGGVVDAGQMFIAREAGPELVASVGRKTAVANNEQIVDMVAGGVAEANSEGNRLLREQNELLRAILAKETGVVLDGRTLLRSTERASRARGTVIMAGGVTG